jgi:hypothetical protein
LTSSATYTDNDKVWELTKASAVIGRHNFQHNDTYNGNQQCHNQQKDTEHNNNQHNGTQYNDAQHNSTQKCHTNTMEHSLITISRMPLTITLIPNQRNDAQHNSILQ